MSHRFNCVQCLCKLCLSANIFSSPFSHTVSRRQLKKRLKEALREIDRLKAGGGFESSEGSSFVTPKAKRALLTGQTPKKSPKAKTKANADGHPQQAEITPADAESAEKATSDGAESIKVSSEVYKELLRETITSFLKSGLVFNKFGRNGKLYQRIVRWSKDMKSVEWFKSHQESPRYVLMNPMNNASVSVKANDVYDLCTLKSDHRTLELVLETRSQKHWAELTHQVVKNRGVSGYLETIDDHL